MFEGFLEGAKGWLIVQYKKFIAWMTRMQGGIHEIFDSLVE